MVAALLFLPVTARAQGAVPNAPVPSGQSHQPAARSSTTTIPGAYLDSTEATIDQETKGQFPTMERGPALPLGTLQRSWDRPTPANGQTAPGVVHYMWHPDFVMGVRTRDFMVTTLMLPTWERVNEFYLGDSVVFEVKKVRANVVAVRSRNAGADSNLTVLGASGNVYNFYLRSETWNSGQVTDLTIYVEAPHADDMVESSDHVKLSGYEPSAGVDDMPDYLRRIVVRPEDIRFDVRMFAKKESDADIAPERVFEDGLFTYFDFGERSDTVARPVVHQLVDGVDAVVNTRTAGPHGNVLIAEAVGDFTLRNGSRVVCVRRTTRAPISPAVTIGGDLRAASGGKDQVR
jgi:type IV secretory pathway VirB9-like protein